MKHKDLPERWQQKLQAYLAENSNSNRKQLSAFDFTTNTLVKINFEDNSTVAFRYAFFIKAEEFREVAVFTEHCGYHIFPLYNGLDLTLENL